MMEKFLPTAALGLFLAIGTPASALPPEGNQGGDATECAFDPELDCYYVKTAYQTVYRAGDYVSCYTIYAVDTYLYDCMSNGPQCKYNDRYPVGGTCGE